MLTPSIFKILQSLTELFQSKTLISQPCCLGNKEIHLPPHFIYVYLGSKARHIAVEYTHKQGSRSLEIISIKSSK